MFFLAGSCGSSPKMTRPESNEKGRVLGTNFAVCALRLCAHRGKKKTTVSKYALLAHSLSIPVKMQSRKIKSERVQSRTYNLEIF